MMKSASHEKYLKDRTTLSTLIRMNRCFSWIMLVLFFITVLSGYSMTSKGDLVRKITLGLINRKNGYFIHINASYVLSILVSFHISVNFRLFLRRRAKVTATFLNVLALALFLLLVLFFTALRF